jgi:hypothetical protein
MSDASPDRLPTTIRWIGYLAWVFLATLVLAVLTVRSGNWQQGLLLYAICCLASLVLLGVLGLLSVLPRFAPRRAALLKRAIPAVPGSVLLITALTASDVPPIHDISTDTEDPPRFEAVPALRAEGSNSLEISDEVMEQQRVAYPDIGTLASPRSYISTYGAALQAARDLDWDIVRDDPNAGYIEAVDTTAIMRFRDDIVIRVRSGEGGSLVDLRSASRVGVSDLGANAARIRRFADRFATLIGE